MIDTVPHGTAGGYISHACRCTPCRVANRVACQKYLAGRRARIADGTQPITIHGISAYRNYGCRCDTCRDANRQACRAYRART